MKKLVFAAAAALILAMPAAVSAEETSSVIVSASSVKTAAPDRATINLSINEYGAEVADVQSSIVGYNVSVSIIIADAAVDDVGDLISRSTEAGANYVGNVEYKCSNYEEVYASALADAVRKAKSKAEAIAAAAEGTLGSIVSITEGYENTSYRSNASYDYGAMKTMGVAEDSIELSPEEAEIEASVTIEYRMN